MDGSAIDENESIGEAYRKETEPIEKIDRGERDKANETETTVSPSVFLTPSFFGFRLGPDSPVTGL